MTRRTLLTAALALALTSCGGKTPETVADYGSEDGQKVVDLIIELANILDEPKELEGAFVPKGAPKKAELKKYADYTYSVVGKPTVEGNKATATVAIEMTASGKKVGEKTWEFAKVGDTWKLKSAPLP